MIKERNIATSIILSIVTCGIYGIVWFIGMTDDANQVSSYKTSGGMAFLLTIVTFGIYSWYWAYQMGKAMHEAGQNKNIGISDNSVLYLILGLFGLGIVDYCLIQSDLNKLAAQSN